MSKQLRNYVGRLVKNESGATMVEYALLVALIAIIAITGINLLGNELNALFNQISNTI